MLITYNQIIDRLTRIEAGDSLPTIAVKFPDRTTFVLVTNMLATQYTFQGAEGAPHLRDMYLRIGKRSSNCLIGIRSPQDNNAGPVPYPNYEHHLFTSYNIIHTTRLISCNSYQEENT